jgi:hypothetical protein
VGDKYYYTDSAILNRQIRSNELIGDNFPLYIKRKIEQTEEKLGMNCSGLSIQFFNIITSHFLYKLPNLVFKGW